MSDGDDSLKLRIIDLETAKSSCLKRRAWDEFPVPQKTLDGIKDLFGEALTPEQAVAKIVADVRARGDAAVVDWTAKLDKVTLTPPQLEVSKQQIMEAYGQITGRTLDALEMAAKRIEQFHRRQPCQSWFENNEEGTLGQLVRPIDAVGVYAPGGTAPLPSSVLMTAIPAKVAGVRKVVLITPPQRDTGLPHPAVLVAAEIAKVDAVYVVGGAQAIAALAYGTETIPKVDKICGPGNLWVTLAKRILFGTVGIDGLPGPTETMVIGDDSADPEFAASDLLAQAEHDIMASAILLTPSRTLAEKVQVAAARQAAALSRVDIVKQALSRNSCIVIVKDVDEAIEVANGYGPEHLCLLLADAWQHLGKVRNAGGVFLGEQSFEVLGDYVAGPSHTMPTGGTARFMSPINVWDFVKIVSVVGLNEHALRKIGPSASALAAVEGLDAHRSAVDLRLKRLHIQ
eukprot:CAMPEP_0196656322 /NCGR_PEP_ID=MMETSP1086-20130531/15478_1 /TAXON_ID=77921 /ORGANISM="Cyanoptyche  gloeocystis , Strain SAG4.97" /LENGTH=456 /DNA_ID=CAMNT_0041989031 /DNA_START=35 /DNA_END=1405 /DNA_ORIENTATION=+